MTLGTIGASGSRVVASNDLTFTASDLPNNAFGYFLTSLPGQIKNTGATGAISLLPNLTQTPTPTGPVAIAIGQTWHFQAWHRDAVGGAAVSNFTDGLSVTFQ